jgi:hypothetical protein
MGVQVTRREFLAATGLTDNGHCGLTVSNPQNLFA